jgi:DNA-binding CsgD family transcriptional regulator
LSQKELVSRPDAGSGGGSERRRSGDHCACAALRFISDQLGYAVLVVSRDNVLVHANTAGWTLLKGDSPFELNHGVVMVQGSVASQWLDSLTKITARARCVAIKHRPARSRQTIDYRIAVTHGVLKRVGDPLVFCIYTSQSQRKIDGEVLRALYDLTPAETATAMGIFAGHSLAEVARERSTSIHTVRTQLKRVLLKCQVRSQLELCRLLATGPGSI